MRRFEIILLFSPIATMLPDFFLHPFSPDTRFPTNWNATTVSNWRRCLTGCLLLITLACASGPRVITRDRLSAPPAPDGLSVANAHYEAGQHAMAQKDWERARDEFTQALTLLQQSSFQSTPGRGMDGRRALRMKVEHALETLAAMNSQPSPKNADTDSLYAEEREVMAGFTQLMHLAQSDTPMAEAEAKLPDFTRFDLPIVMNRRVKQAIYFLHTTAAAPFSLWLNRANRYLPMIQSILWKEGLPRDLVFVALIESGFDPRAYSEDGAAGLWQFMMETGQEYDLFRTEWIDKRLDPEKSTLAAASHFKNLYTMFGDWELVIAAHHAGVDTVRHIIQTTGNSDFWQMKLPRDTGLFVPLVMAAAIVAKNPSAYGFQVQSVSPLAYETVVIDQSLPLQAIVKSTHVALDQLQTLNPELRKWQAPPDGYPLKIPVGSQPNFQAWLGITPPKQDLPVYTVRRGDTIKKVAQKFRVDVADLMAENELQWPVRLKPGQTLVIPADDQESAAEKSRPDPRPPEAPPQRDAATTYSKEPDPKTHTRLIYIVKRGDTLLSISRRYRVPVAAIQSWNKIYAPGDILVGQKLMVWVPVTPAPGRKTTSPKTDAQKLIYIVKEGNTLWEIARKFNVTVGSVRVANNLSQRSTIRPGDKLIIILPAGVEKSASSDR